MRKPRAGSKASPGRPRTYLHSLTLLFSCAPRPPKAGHTFRYPLRHRSPSQSYGNGMEKKKPDESCMISIKTLHIFLIDDLINIYKYIKCFLPVVIRQEAIVLSQFFLFLLYLTFYFLSFSLTSYFIIQHFKIFYRHRLRIEKSLGHLTADSL